MGFLYVSTWIRLMWDGCVRVDLLEQSSQNRNNIISYSGAPDVWYRTPYDVSGLSSVSVRVS